MVAFRKPDTMTPADRDAEIACILARGVVRAIRIARGRPAPDIGIDQDSREERLELSPHGGLSVSARPAG